jgi:phospholipid/cholesterol/gamma-HCH transport system ATP-binding protein
MSDGKSQPLVRVDSLSIRFGRQAVLRDVSLDVPAGETLALIGESGCGKTVLLKCLVGLLRPNEGEVWFDGHNLAELGQRDLTQLRTRLGFVFQGAALFDSMTVAQNVAFPLRQHTRRSPQEVEEIVRERLAEVGLPDNVIPKKPAELSGGMRKRVGLARALVMDPELVLYDEPTTGLDPVMSDVINELILRTRKRHPVTSIVVTHDMRTAQKVADRIVMLAPLARLDDDEPQVLYDGPPRKIEASKDQRVIEFVRGDAGSRLLELASAGGRGAEL